MSWSDVDLFAGDAGRADDERLLEMYRWAVDHERQSNAQGSGRNPKARKMFNTMSRAAAEELERRGLTF
jgi:hypothetical protein